MTEHMTDQEVRRLYNKYDEKFRAAKKKGLYKTASEWKAKRDALESRLNEAIKRAAQEKSS